MDNIIAAPLPVAPQRRALAIWLRRAAWALASVLGLWALAWLAVPPLVKNQLEKIATDQLGRQVRVGAVDFKPWTLELTLNDLTVAKALPATGEQLRIQRIYMDAELQSILRLAPVVDAVQVDAPQISLTHLGGGRYDIDDMVARIQALSKDKKETAPKAEQAQFAIYNIAIKDGAASFTDQTVGKTHILRNLQLSLPFLSNMRGQRDVKTAPRLAFALNGSQFDSAAQATPFASSRQADASLKIVAFDLAPYLGYLPADLPVKLQSAVLAADLKIAFTQTPRVAVQISGLVQASGVAVQDATGAALLSFDKLTIRADDVRPLERSVQLQGIELTAPEVQIRRNKAGQLNLLASTNPKSAIKTGAVGEYSMGVTDIKPSENSEKNTWKINVGTFALTSGALRWTDESTTPVAQLSVQEIVLQARDLVYPFAQEKPLPLVFDGSANVVGSAVKDKTAVLSFQGTASDQSASVTSRVSGLALGLAAPYLSAYVYPALGATAQAEMGILWTAGSTSAKGKPMGLRVDVRQAQLADVVLSESAAALGTPSKQGGKSLLAFKKLEVADAVVDLASTSVQIAKIGLTGLNTQIERGIDGRWMFETWLKLPAPGVSTAASSPAPHPAPGAAADKAWSVAVAEINVDAPRLGFVDRAPTGASTSPQTPGTQTGTERFVALTLSQVKAQLRVFSTDGKKSMPMRLSAKVSPGVASGSALDPGTGSIDIQGSVALVPLALQATVNVQRVPVHSLEPYFGDALNVDLLRADTSFNGQVQVAQSTQGMRVKVSGDTAVEDFAAHTRNTAEGARLVGGADSNELLSWRALSLRGLSVNLSPGVPAQVEVQQTALSDYFARIVVNEQGRINLQDIVKSTPNASATVTTSAAVPSPASAVSAANAPATADQSVITMGEISLINGKVNFSDRFIKPNYSANMSELTGKLGAFSSQAKDAAVQLADLQLRGRVEGTAALEILGKLNPLAKPLALDIKGKVRDLELPPLSPYAIKYAGYGIERGKLSVDVAYLVKPDGQLTASNNIVLSQLKFGDKVEGAPGNLPVKLAVALLADRNGVIDINLPVSGSLSDPQFSIGGIVFKLIINLVVKAITSPFSLLASAFGGGGDELSAVIFAPGSAVVSAQATASLDKVAKALQERPALKMTVVGTSSMDIEREDYKKERLKALLQAEKRRASVVSGGTTTAQVNVSEAEYPALLKALYQRTDLPKPRNAIGLTKDIPTSEMQALMLAHLPVTDQAINDLALQRGVAVRDYLASTGLPTDRLFLGAPKTVPPDAKWTPRAELGLATQ